MKRRQTQGFTIVEMIIVIVVMAILATIVSVLYLSAQTQARDTQVRDAAAKFAGAITLLANKHSKGAMPAGGAGSTGAATATGCPNGTGGWQGPATPGVQCTLGDAVIATGYLPSGFFSELPANAASGQPGQNFMVQQCSDGYYLLYAQEQPDDASIQKVTSLVAGACSAKAAAINGKAIGGYIKLDVLPLP